MTFFNIPYFFEFKDYKNKEILEKHFTLTINSCIYENIILKNCIF